MGSEAGAGPTLADLGEDELLARLFPLLPRASADVRIGPGDDAAVLDPSSVSVASVDAMVRGRDWRDEWSTGADVGAKAVAQNLADIAAMGAMGTALLVTLLADPATPVQWVTDFASGLGEAARESGVAVVGGDLSSAPPGVLAVSVTSLGRLEGAPVLRSGAQVGDVVAVAGGLGRSGAGLLLLQQGRAQQWPELAAFHRRPRPPYRQGPVAARAGATAMLDVSDGLLRDAGRIAAASGVRLDLERALLEGDVQALAGAVGDEAALGCVLAGGEEHSLLACYPDAEALPPGWRLLGQVVPGSGVSLDDVPQRLRGWDHFGG